MRIYPIFFFIIALISFSCHSSSHSEEQHEEDHHHAPSALLSPEKEKEFGIEYETIQPADFHHVIKTSGTIEAASSDVYTLTASKSGIVRLSPSVNNGVAVKSGEKIGVISPDGVQGGDISQAAISNLNIAKAEYERLKPLFEEGLITASALREAERAYKEAEALAGKGNPGGEVSIKSPATGVITGLFVRSGEYVDAGAPIALISKNSELLLNAHLPAREAKHLPEISDARFIPEGSAEIFEVSALNGEKISGNSSSSQGYIPVYFSFSGNSFSTPGGYAEVFLICAPRPDVISVPRGALIELQGNKYVYVSEDDGSFDKKLVKTGTSDGERIEILEGLSPGEKIVSKGASIVRMAELSAIAPPAHNHNH